MLKLVLHRFPSHKLDQNAATDINVISIVLFFMLHNIAGADCEVYGVYPERFAQEAVGHFNKDSA